MKYRLQILSVFAVLIIVFLGARGLARKNDISGLADISAASESMLAAPSSAVSTGTTDAATDKIVSAMLGEDKPLTPRAFFFRTANDPAPETSAQEILIADVQSGEKYFELSSVSRWPIASLTKLMSGILAYANLNLDATTTIQDTDLADGDNAGVSAGETYKVRDLLKVMLVASKNTAANALARAYGYDNFITLMNGKAKEWGMNDTHFNDPSGLSVANQSTANDLLKLVRGVSAERPEVWKTTENAKVSIKELNSGKIKSFASTNQFVSRKDFYGGKTGYTPEADGNLISVFLYGKRTVVIIVLGSADRFGDSEKLFNWFSNDFKPSN